MAKTTVPPELGLRHKKIDLKLPCISVHLAYKVGLLVGVLVYLSFEVDVGGVHVDIGVKLARRKPGPGEVPGQVTVWQHHLVTNHKIPRVLQQGGGEL